MEQPKGNEQQLLAGFSHENGVYYLTPYQPSEWENDYLAVRTKEVRLLSDLEVSHLPLLSKEHPHHKEWLIRKASLELVVKHFEAISAPDRLLDLGCGNGWWSHRIARTLPNTTVLGVDMNKPELEQACRVFEASNLNFAYGDIFVPKKDLPRFNIIVLNSVWQYFESAHDLIKNLMEHWLTENGEIHIMDSPIYSSDEVSAAAERTRKYFLDMGFPQLSSHYHPHSWDELQGFSYEVKYRPGGFLQKSLGKIGRIYPVFPWVIIKA